MLVYTSRFSLQPNGGTQQIVSCIARWLSQTCRGQVDIEKLFSGQAQRVRGRMIECRNSGAFLEAADFPFLFCVQLSHPDSNISGRKWFTEIGIRQANQNSFIECTVLMRTEEISSRVITPPKVTRPKIIENLIDDCNPVGDAPGLSVKRLDKESAEAFLRDVERMSREHPIVVVSARDGVYQVVLERLRSLLVGIADVVQVPADADTFEIEEVVGGRYAAWGGAINIIFPARILEDNLFCSRILYLPNELEVLQAKGEKIEDEILSQVTHRTNLPNSWNHISLETVDQERLRIQLSASILKVKELDNANEYAALLIEADKELNSKDKDIANLRQDLEEGSSRYYLLEAKNAALQHALNERLISDGNSEDVLQKMRPLREDVAALVIGKPTPIQSLKIISTLFPERLVVLDSAYESAQESREFIHGKQAFDLLWTLANDYWSALASGQGDSVGRRVFGVNDYAQNEGNALSKSGRSRRTFNYLGVNVIMEKHLKIGIKPSVSETLRIHFEWIGSDKKIIIGHCGQHLNFS